jgi:hypothetical protein
MSDSYIDSNHLREEVRFLNKISRKKYKLVFEYSGVQLVTISKRFALPEITKLVDKDTMHIIIHSIIDYRMNEKY